MPRRFINAALARVAGAPVRRVETWVLLAGMISGGGCGDDATRGAGSSPGSSAIVPTFIGIVSNPVAGLAPAGPSAYVSLPRGTIPSGYRATIRNRATGNMVTTAIADGGFDPVAVTAGAGDTLELDVLVAESQAPRQFRSTVPAARRPMVVRTDPQPRSLDARLDASLLILFSEPIDSATVSKASVRLLHGGSPIDGAVRFSDPAHLALEFTPASPLAPLTEYRLVVSRTVRDLDGDSLATDVESAFTTGACRGNGGRSREGSQARGKPRACPG